ncbi:GNAT family N-acetyltransferase [Natronosporangium hydrolyticum]|uniref:GNAT family N-acetyltransferase n=1 Tax=Natronosporangium hydrolyticum TaxID=2811111 RepID=A0A895YFH4_9ACTN|nr:GNAT family N-acetyltransferase [Natronosporangium hydrolyticum]QSB14872.1 GNAT family N-acetyltransferase [Natronosporangium hydrolyticum]
MSVSIRAYRPADHNRCRGLWAELTELQRDLYDEPGRNDADPGAGFEDYLTRLDLSGMWVAEHSEAGVIGLIGLILSGRAGEVYPVVVTEPYRNQGVGTALLAHVAEEARRRSLKRLLVMPESRNLAAIKTLHRVGYDTMAAVRLTMELSGKPSNSDEIVIHDLPFRS